MKRQESRGYRLLLAALTVIFVGAWTFYAPMELTRLLEQSPYLFQAFSWEQTFFWTGYGIGLATVFALAYKAWGY